MNPKPVESQPTYLFRLAEKRQPGELGAKAFHLRQLVEKGFAIPATWVVSCAAYQRYLAGDLEFIPHLRAELAQRLDPAQAYAVRSSASIEDSLERSFAGQFKTLLNLRGVDEIYRAVWSIWATAQSLGVQTYVEKLPAGGGELCVAVIIQEMVTPRFSGVAFSRNPITGLDEIVVEAVPGSGAMLVQEGVTPLRWTCRFGEWSEQPAQCDLPEAVVRQVVEQTAAIARKFRADVDLEWAWDGERVIWLQMRQITSLKDLVIYSNRISKEMLPGQVKPLTWSVNVPATNRQWVRLLTEIIGANDIDPLRMARQFHYRTYFNMGVFEEIFDRLGMPRQSLERMMGILPPDAPRARFKMRPGMLRLLPRLIGFLAGKWRYAGRAEAILRTQEERQRAFPGEPGAELTPAELLAQIDRLREAQTEITYNNIVIPLSMMAYNAQLNRQLQRAGVDAASFDLTAGMEELHAYDPNHHLAELNRQFRQLPGELQAKLGDMRYADFQALPGIGEFQSAVSRFIDRFGHLSDSGNDFTSRTWRESPELVLKMIALYQPPAEKGKKVRLEDMQLGGLRGWLLRLFHRRARRFRYYREWVSSLYTRHQAMLRNHYLALGARLSAAGKLPDAGDIFYLEDAELRQLVKGEADPASLAQVIQRRREEMEASASIELPTIIYGDDPPPVMPKTGNQLRGTPTARGYYTGPVRVVRGIADFPKVKPGDVLVIPYSDVGWTPLFAKAGAVIAESGGMLSHSSIIAREYHIPAVVSVPGALELTDDMLVSIDGYKGEIVVHAEQPVEQERS